MISTNGVGQTSTTSVDNQDETQLEVLQRLHKRYGEAKLILKNRDVFKRITVHEINNFWFVFIKDGSLHDVLIENVARIEFAKELGPTITFTKDNKVIIRY